MSPPKMHEGEVATDAGLVRRLLDAQFPHWAELPIERVASYGTDNAIYRIGDELVARLPRIDWATAQIDKEHRWLPVLAPHLPLAIPQPVAIGTPGEGYPWKWAIHRWLRGEPALPEHVQHSHAAAEALGAFVAALRRIEYVGGPASRRGVPIGGSDTAVRSAIAAAADLVDVRRATDLWERALEAPEWDRTPAWSHGDLSEGNVLMEGGQLCAVIDFGMLGVGDPACDLASAWMLFTAETRPTFRAAVGADDAEWARGKGRALISAVVALPYYRRTNPGMMRRAFRTLHELANDERGSR